MFDIGQEVICVNDENQSLDGEKWVKKDQKYTVRWIGNCVHPFFTPDGDLCVRLEGIERTSPDLNVIGLKLLGFDQELQDMPFSANRFRPIETKKMDISVFTALLNPEKVKEPV